MQIEGWYYLHTNGDLIYKREIGDTAADIRESDFAVGLWPFMLDDRESAWRILIEGLAGGAKKGRIIELATKWHCNNEDAEIYAKRVGCNLFMDGDRWAATKLDFDCWPTSPAGFGDTKLEAMAALAVELGYKPSKIWSTTFSDLLHKEENSQFGVGG